MVQDFATKEYSNEFLALCGMGLGLIAILGVICIGIAVVIAVYRHKTLRYEMETTVKLEMIDRGMSADDIERVLNARFGKSKGSSVASFFDAMARARKCGTPEPQVKQA